MVSDRTRNAVWQNYLDVSRLGMYYETLANRYRWYYISLRVALLLSVIGSVASPLTPLNHPAATTALVIVTIILVAMDYALDLAKKSAVLQEVSIQVKGLESDWEMLWLSVDDEDADESKTRRKNRALNDRLLEVTGRSLTEGILINNKLNQKSMEIANAVINEKYKHAREE